MVDKLIAYKNNRRTGILSRDEESYSFCYDSEWLEQAMPTPLSLSLPLQEKPFTPEQTRPFFSNLLPEGPFRDHIANQHRISPEDDFALLAALAGDCAGAIALYSENAPPPAPEKQQTYRLLTKEDEKNLFEEAFIMDLSFLGSEEKTRLSLAGMQDKLPVMVKDGDIYLPLDGAPSTHILKPQHFKWKSLVENEAFCMTLAREMGLDVPETFIFQGDDITYMIERYDRDIDGNGIVRRIHQEDFCQALGFSYRKKYEENGGPGHKECFNLVRGFKNPLKDRIRLIDLTIFNLLISNYDCHAKNISLIYENGAAPSLAPCYDLVCVGVYNLESRLAMSIGGVFDPKDLTLESWETFAEDIGSGSVKPVIKALEKMAGNIAEAAQNVAKSMIEKYGDNAIYNQIVDKINNRIGITLRQIKSWP